MTAASAFPIVVFVLGQKNCIKPGVGNSPSSLNES
jgi:hypothetical protein